MALVLTTLASCSKEKSPILDAPEAKNAETTTTSRSNITLAPDLYYLLNGQTLTKGDQIVETESMAVVVEGENTPMVFDSENRLYDWAVSNDKTELVNQIERIRHYRKIGKDLGFPEEVTDAQWGQLIGGSEDRSPGMFLFTGVNQGGSTWPSGPTWSYGGRRNTASSFAGVGGATLFDGRWFQGQAIFLLGLTLGNLNGPVFFFDDRAESGI